MYNVFTSGDVQGILLQYTGYLLVCTRYSLETYKVFCCDVQRILLWYTMYYLVMYKVLCCFLQILGILSQYCFLSVHALWIITLLIHFSRCVLCFYLLPSSGWPSPVCQIPSCCDPPSTRSGLSLLSGIEPHSDSLMLTSRTAITLRVLATYTRYLLFP